MYKNKYKKNKERLIYKKKQIYLNLGKRFKLNSKVMVRGYIVDGQWKGI